MSDEPEGGDAESRRAARLARRQKRRDRALSQRRTERESARPPRRRRRSSVDPDPDAALESSPGPAAPRPTAPGIVPVAGPGPVPPEIAPVDTPAPPGRTPGAPADAAFAAAEPPVGRRAHRGSRR